MLNRGTQTHATASFDVFPASIRWLTFAVVTLLYCQLALAEVTPTVSDTRLGEILAGDEPRNVAELQAMQVHVQKLIQKVMPTVVSIDMQSSQGSGVVVTADGYVLTAGHVISQPKKPAILRFKDGNPVRAKTLGINNGIDSGLVKISREKTWPYAEMGDSSKLEPGQWVLAVGHPGGYQSERGAVVRLGRILSINETGLRTDCALVGGDSGGPLFDMEGRVIGINSRIGDDLDKNIHVPVNTFGNTWDRLVAAERWGNFSQLFRPGWIGMTINREGEQAEITKVAEGGPAEKAGILVGDIITEFDGVEISDYRSLLTIVLQTPANEIVDVTVIRGEETFSFKLETQER